MRTITFHKGVSGVVCALAVMLVSPSASGQVLNESAKLLASDGAQGDQFGFSASVSGDVAVVGAFTDDDNGDFSGSAYMFRWNGSSWVQQQKLLASDGVTGDQFGFSASVSGDVVVVGARSDDDNGTSSGSAYVFRWNGSSWAQEQKLLPPDGAAGDMFGWRVSVSGNVAVVGAPNHGDNGSNSGSAYVFRWNPGAPGSWVQEQKLLPSDGAAYDQFGVSVSVSGDVVVVGAPRDDDACPTNPLCNSGAAYVFRWNPGAPGSWVQEQKLLPSDGQSLDDFGFSASISGGVAVVGAPNDANGNTSGSAYVFRRNGSSWVQEQKLLATDGDSFGQFGWSVSVSGNVAIVGAHADADNGHASGSAYVFRWNAGAPGSWVQEQKLLPLDGAADDRFGESVSVSGDVGVIGAFGDDENGDSSGSAYVFVGLCDSDGDGVCDSDDVCPDSRVGETIVIDGCATGIANEMSDNGCTRADAVAVCAEEARNHGQFVQCVAHLVNVWKRSGAINGADHGRITHCAARADIPPSDDKHGNGSSGPARLSDRAAQPPNAKHPVPSSGGRN
ncbi:MAG: FG-GAP repeat protein [Phycisphaerales bacterium]|nr:FG-GAP repeat protein [Phycisphaerales bacterium]